MNSLLLVCLIWGFFCLLVFFLFYTIAAKRGGKVKFGDPVAKILCSDISSVSQHFGPSVIPFLALDLFYHIPSAAAPKSSRCCSVWEKGPFLTVALK